MQTLSNIQKLKAARTMLHLLIVASKTTDKNLPLKKTTDFLESIYDLLASIIKNIKEI